MSVLYRLVAWLAVVGVALQLGAGEPCFISMPAVPSPDSLPLAPTPTLAVVVSAPAERLAEQVSQLKAHGVGEMVLVLPTMPSEAEWRRVLETLESSGLAWWLCLRGLPRTEGWLCAPERYRTMGNAEGVYSIQLDGATRALIAVSPADTPNLRTLTQVALSEGHALYAQGDTVESVLLIYPLVSQAVPGLWEGWDQYRDRLMALLQKRRPQVGFRGWVVEQGWDALTLAGFPTSKLARTEWEGFLRARYPHLIELERAWDLSGGVSSYAEASRLIPLWRDGRGLPFLVDAEDPRKTQEIDPSRSQFWNDYHAFLAERWNNLLAGLREALQATTSEAEFLLIRPADDPTELELPPAFRFPLVPNGIRLDAAWQSLWGTLLTVAVAESETQVYPIHAVWLEASGLDAERASLLQARARSLGIRKLFWEIPMDQLPTVWSTLQSTDSPPEKPQFVRFPKGLWGVTSVQKYPSGWWVPQDSARDQRPVLWGFALPGFWRTVEVQSVDKVGKMQTATQVELALWSPDGDQEVVLRRADRNPLEAIDLDGKPVRLEARGDTVRVRVGSVPVRVRGFSAIPLCESCVEQWVQRAQELLKRTPVGGQDPEILRFNLQGAQELYRKDRASGFDSVRSAWFETERAYMPYRWLEAEATRNHSFGTVRRDACASGGATLWVRSPLVGSFYARYTLNLRTDGNYTFWLAVRLQSNRSLGKVRWQIFQDSEASAPMAQGESELKPERAHSAYADQFAWFSLGSVGLKAGDYLLHLEWLPLNSQPPYAMEWDALLVAPVGIQPTGNRFPKY